MATSYSSLITSQHATKPRFRQMVDLLAGAFGQMSDQLLSMPDAFDIDQAVGVQLDAVGLWVGLSRRQITPIANVFFTWNDANLGWNRGSWKGPFEPSQGVVNLDDNTYRAVLKAKIGANYWSGSNEDLQQIGLTALGQFDIQCFAIDNFDMTITIYILGAPSAILIEMIKRGVVPPKSAGVRVTGYILASSPGAPFFALSVPTTTEVAGLDFGSFGDPV